MCSTCGCKSAETGKKNCGCGQDPCKTYGAEYHRDSKGRFTEKPILTGSVVGGLALGLIYLMRGK